MPSSRLRHRRHFFKTTVATSAALSLGAKPAYAANQRLRIAVIGTGSQGSGHVERFAAMANDNVELAYVCDVDQKRLAEAARRAPGAKPVSDLRRILDDRTIDAVSIATPDHWHAPAAILACEAGKHVYVEKPCCHNVLEGKALVETARRTNRVVQHGTQQRSRPFTAGAIELLREGIIGDVLVAKAWNIQRRKNIGHHEPTKPPPGFDYDMWVGPAEETPFRKNCHHYNWRWWYNFGTGDMGNDGAHEIDYARWGLGVEGLPNRISAMGGKYYFDDDQQFPDTITASFEYPGDGTPRSKRQLIFEMRLWSKNYPFNTDSGVEYYGTKGKMFISKRGKFEVLDDSNKRIPDLDSATHAKLKVDNHYRDFVDAIRSGRKPNAEIETGFHSAAVCNLGNVAVRAGRTLTLDAEKMEFVGDVEATKLLGRSYRSGGHWAIPKLGINS